MTLFCGIDWAETHHDIAIIDGDGQLLVKKRIPGAMRCILLCPMPAIRRRSARRHDGDRHRARFLRAHRNHSRDGNMPQVR